MFLALPAKSGWYAGDGHVHTAWSPDVWFISIDSRAKEAKSDGFGFIIITDHEDGINEKWNEYVGQCNDAQSKRKIPVLPGVEIAVKDDNGHALGYAMDENAASVPDNQSLQPQALIEAINKLKAAGLKGLVGNSAYRKYLKLNDNEAEIDVAKVQEEVRYDGRYVLRTTTDLPAGEVAQAYKQLWRVERAFRELKHRLEVRPMYHWTDKRIRGHVMVCFLAFYLETRLHQALREVARPEACYAKVLRDLMRVKAVRLTVERHTFIARTELQGDAYLAFKAVKMRVPPQVLHLDATPKKGCGGTLPSQGAECP